MAAFSKKSGFNIKKRGTQVPLFLHLYNRAEKSLPLMRSRASPKPPLHQSLPLGGRWIRRRRRRRATSLPAAGGGIKGKRSVCRGRQDASLLCQAKRLPGTANGEKEENSLPQSFATQNPAPSSEGALGAGNGKDFLIREALGRNDEKRDV